MRDRTLSLLDPDPYRLLTRGVSVERRMERKRKRKKKLTTYRCTGSINTNTSFLQDQQCIYYYTFKKLRTTSTTFKWAALIIVFFTFYTHPRPSSFFKSNHKLSLTWWYMLDIHREASFRFFLRIFKCQCME